MNNSLRELLRESLEYAGTDDVDYNGIAKWLEKVNSALASAQDEAMVLAYMDKETGFLYETCATEVDFSQMIPLIEAQKP